MRDRVLLHPFFSFSVRSLTSNIQTHTFVFSILDDLVVYSGSLAEHVIHMRMVLRRLQNAGFTLNPDKITMVSREIKYLGHLLSAEGIRVLPERVASIQNYPCPQNLRGVRRFVWMVGFYARFIPDYSRLAEPLHALKRKGAKFVWTADQQTAFERLKKSLCEAPLLQTPEFSKEFRVMHRCQYDGGFRCVAPS